MFGERVSYLTLIEESAGEQDLSQPFAALLLLCEGVVELPLRQRAARDQELAEPFRCARIPATRCSFSGRAHATRALWFRAQE